MAMMLVSSQLDAARFNVTLNDITETGGVYSLVGPRAQIVDFDAPFKGMFTQNSPDFIFNRTADAFEAVSCYYHIDFMMDYINNTLGCDIMPYQYSGGVKFDPHGSNGGDNSFYTGGTGQLSFGEGGVDDGEDSDVIHHELGHGLHDWVTNGGLSQVDGLSEGSGDYVAQSYNRSLGNWGPTDPANNFVFNWDGHNPFWNGRSTNYFPGYPGGLVGQIHQDGQIWASCLMTVWDEIGQQRMDKIFYEGLGMTGGNSSQNDAANAVYQAALNLSYTPEEIVDIHTNLTACGYTLPALPGPPIAAIDADNSTICLDDNNTVNFMDASNPPATTWSWSFEGGVPATSDQQNPSVTYAAAGTYDVTLTVTNDEGNDTMTFTNFVTVLQGDDCPSCTTTTNNTPVTITTTGGVEYTSVINISEDMEITDVNVTVDITHSWNNDLIISIVSPEGTEVELSNRNGDSDDDDYANTVFDQEASTSIVDGTSPFNGTFIPEGDLSTIYGEMSAGDWTLKIFDAAAQDGGQLNTWSLELCLAPQLSVEENSFDAFTLFPNPNDGSFTIKLSSFSNQDISVGVYDIRGRSVYNNTFDSTTEFEQPIQLNALQSGMYLVKIEDGDRRAIRKIVIK